MSGLAGTSSLLDVKLSRYMQLNGCQVEPILVANGCQVERVLVANGCQVERVLT